MSAIMPRIGAIFVPVADVEQARYWYARLLGMADAPEIQFGHLAVFAFDNGLRLVLDAKILDADARRNSPLFHFDVEDIAAAREHVVKLRADAVSEIQFDHWFTFRDPDGNVLMACVC